MPAPQPPQHPFDQIHGVETSGLIAAGNLITGVDDPDANTRSKVARSAAGKSEMQVRFR